MLCGGVEKLQVSMLGLELVYVILYISFRKVMQHES
jgi:hypothetical protein